MAEGGCTHARLWPAVQKCSRQGGNLASPICQAGCALRTHLCTAPVYSPAVVLQAVQPQYSWWPGHWLDSCSKQFRTFLPSAFGFQHWLWLPGGVVELTQHVFSVQRAWWLQLVPCTFEQGFQQVVFRMQRVGSSRTAACSGWGPSRPVNRFKLTLAVRTPVVGAWWLSSCTRRYRHSVAFGYGGGVLCCVQRHRGGCSLGTCLCC
jgi:hypothetical protein